MGGRGVAADHVGPLDSLRGLAALVVVMHHCAMTLPGAREWMQSSIVLRPLVAGPSAVLVFFTLSGFVLHLSLERHDAFRYGPYLVRRFARIYPPLAFAVLLSAALHLVVSPTPIGAASGWFNHLSWNHPADFPTVAGHLLLLDGTRYQNLDNVVWSLVHEIRIMLVFPLLVLCMRRRTAATLAATAAVSAAAAWTVEPAGVDTLVSPLSTIQYVFLFAAGAAMAQHRTQIRTWMAGPGGRLAGPALIVVGVISGTMAQRTAVVGAICLVALCFSHAPTMRALDRPALRRLGDVSYSLYLLHLPVMLALVHVLHDDLPIPAALALAVAASMAAATASRRWIERPAIAAGRRVAARIERTTRRRVACQPPTDPA